MKRNILFSIQFVLGLLLFVSCQRADIASPDDFSVTSSKAVYKVGDTVRFNFTGRPDQIVFYSGDVGMNYTHLNKQLDSAGVVKLVFQSSLQAGILNNGDSLHLMVSSNLGGYDITSVMKANWFDVTSRNTKWPTSVNAVYTSSDSIDLSDFKKFDSINIAFRYKGLKNTGNSRQKWAISAFSLMHLLPDGSNYPLFAPPLLTSSVSSSQFTYTGWVEASLNKDSVAWNVGNAGLSPILSLKNSDSVLVASSYPLLLNTQVQKLDKYDYDDWVITTKVNLKKIYPDQGVVIKNVVASSLNSFDALPSTYFKKPGVYMVTFVAVNQGPTGTKQVVKQVAITVTP